MNQSRIDDEGSDFYRAPRQMPHGTMWMRRFDIRPHQEVPESPGWVWFLTGVAIGAILIALVLA